MPSFAWAVSLLKTRWMHAKKLGCNRRSRAVVGNVWNVLHMVLHMVVYCIAEVCPAQACSACIQPSLCFCLQACLLVTASGPSCCGPGAGSSLPSLFDAPISGRNRRRPDSSQESMRGQPEPRTQTRTAKRKTGFISSSPPAASTAVGHSAELGEHRSLAQPQHLPEQTVPFSPLGTAEQAIVTN